MITTVTLNPSLDLTLEVDTFAVGEVNRAHSDRLEAAGKGVNVAMALAEQGVAARALVAVDPMAAPRWLELLAAPSVVEVIDVVEAEGLIRTNVAIVAPNGVVTKVNGPGPTYGVATLATVMEAVTRRFAGSRWLVLSGSLPPGCPDDTYAVLVEAAHRAGCSVAVDADGPALRHAITAGPDLIKPNLPELEQLTGHELRRVADVVRAAASLVDRGVGSVLCSLGPDGAILCSPQEVAHAWAPPTRIDSTVGAGDALLAGFLSTPEGGREALRAAVAWGSAACSLPGSRMPDRRDVDLAAVEIATHPDGQKLLDAEAAAGMPAGPGPSGR